MKSRMTRVAAIQPLRAGHAVLSCAAVLLALLMPAQALGASPPEEKLKQVSEFLQAERSRLGAPGLSAAVVLENRLAFAAGFGLADLENNVPATEKTVYRIGSLSTSITAIGVLKLVAEGKLRLEASARDYVPEYPDKKAIITVRHLLGHLAGVGSFKHTEEFFNQKHYDTLLASIETFKNRPLVSQPGQAFRYSTYGYTLLGLVIERVSGMAFEEYLKARIFDPLKMSATGLDEPQRLIPHRAGGYVRGDAGTFRNARFVDVSACYPGAGMVSSVEDLARLAIAINTATVLPPRLVTEMTTSGKTTSGAETNYGMGWFIRQDGDRRIIGNAGLGSKGSAFLLLYPEDQAAVVVMVNLEKTDVIEVALGVGRLVLGYSPAEKTPPTVPQPGDSESP
jgi:serine beta-lactamase-like protein LACTB